MKKRLGWIAVGVIAVAGLAALLASGVALARSPWARTNRNMMWGNSHNPGGSRGFMGDRGMMGIMYGSGMMGYFGSTGLASVEPLNLEEARQAIGKYLPTLGNSDLSLGEIIIFDNHAYAQIIEKSTGIGALEVLVDPVTLAVVPEFGPTMMWNLKYGHMGSGGTGWGSMMGGSGRGSMMGGFGTSSNPSQLFAGQTISASEALQIARQFLDASSPGAKVAEAADPFYGYYTIEILKDGKIAGMLSVNGYTGQVWLHTWHGSFVEESD